MSTLDEHLDDYLRLRRGLGFALGQHGLELPHFVAYLKETGAATATVESAVAWARLPAGIKPITVDYRLSAVRGFARYLPPLTARRYRVHRRSPSPPFLADLLCTYPAGARRVCAPRG